MEEKLIFTIVIPKRYIEIYNEFERIVEEDDRFKEALQKLDKRYQKKTKNNVLRSAKIRFLISEYVVRSRRKKREKEQNV